jgi:competence protein ComEC
MLHFGKVIVKVTGVFGATALDCRGGEAVFLTLPDQTTILIGAGGTGRARSQLAPAKKWDPGENIVSPYLWSRRIKALDVVVVTSVAGNLDGFTSILQNFRVGELWFENPDDVAAIVDEAARRHVALRSVSPGERLRVGGALVEVLAFGEGARASAGTEPLNIRITSSGATVAAAGSTSFIGQQRLLESNGDARSLILTTGRQTLVWAADSNTPGSDLPLAGPDLAEDRPDDDLRIASLATGSRYRVLRTDRDGAVTVEMRGDRLRVSDFRDSTTRAVISRTGEANR